MGEGNCFGYDGCKVVEGGRESVGVVVGEVRGGVEVRERGDGCVFHDRG